MMRLLIDTELFMFQAATACEFEMEWGLDDWTYVCRHGDAKAAFQDVITDAMSTFPDHRTICFAFGDRANFRYSVWPHYKSNRKAVRKPAGYRQLLQWVETMAATHGWPCIRLQGVEADDVLGLNHEEGDVIVSFDKDMLTLPGLHYRNGEVVEVSQRQADLAFFTQAIVGDASDGYPGCPGCGPVAAEKALAGCETEGQMWRAVVAAFNKKGLSADHALAQARCARILRPGEYDPERGIPLLWSPP